MLGEAKLNPSLRSSLHNKSNAGRKCCPTGCVKKEYKVNQLYITQNCERQSIISTTSNLILNPHLLESV